MTSINFYKRILCALCGSLLSLSMSVHAGAQAFVIDPSEIKYVYDGDTFYIYCRSGLKCINNKLGIRALGLDTPEMKGECKSEIKQARLAKQFLVELKNSASTITIQPDNKRPYDKYDRLLAHVWFNNANWTETMIYLNLGRVWTGKRGGWC